MRCNRTIRGVGDYHAEAGRCRVEPFDRIGWDRDVNSQCPHGIALDFDASVSLALVSDDAEACPSQSLDGEVIELGVRVAIKDLDCVAVADAVIRQAHKDGIAVGLHGYRLGGARGQDYAHQCGNQNDQPSIKNSARSYNSRALRPTVNIGIQIVEGIVSDEKTGSAYLGHHTVARIDAERTLNAFQLWAFADVNAHRAYRDALRTVDTVASRFPGFALFVRAARLSAVGSVANEERVRIKHRPLNAWPGAHVSTHLLARDTTQKIGGEGEDAEEQPCDRRGRARQELMH